MLQPSQQNLIIVSKKSSTQIIRNLSINNLHIIFFYVSISITTNTIKNESFQYDIDHKLSTDKISQYYKNVDISKETENLFEKFYENLQKYIEKKIPIYQSIE